MWVPALLPDFLLVGINLGDFPAYDWMEYAYCDKNT
jgi:hypothetical protein